MLAATVLLGSNYKWLIKQAAKIQKTPQLSRTYSIKILSTTNQ